MQAFKCSFMFDGAFIRDYSAGYRNTRKAKQMNRENWLQQVASALEPIFASKGAPLPGYRVSCSFPSTGGLSAKRKTIGQCWDASASADGTTEIFISPTQDDPVEVAATLCHELVHAAVSVAAGHGPAFRKVALEMGLQGKMTATEAGENFKTMIAPILAQVGEYPHARLDATQRKKQTTRMVKCVCDCGYTVRTTAKWIEVGVPHCPLHGEMIVAS